MSHRSGIFLLICMRGLLSTADVGDLFLLSFTRCYKVITDIPYTPYKAGIYILFQWNFFVLNT